MKITNQYIGATKTSGATGIVLLVTAVLAAATSFMDIRLGFAVFAVTGILALIRFSGLGRYVPRTSIGWLYAAIIFVTCWAPSLGLVGTLGRFAVAAISLLALLHSFRTTPPPRLSLSLRTGLALLVVSLVLSTVAAASTGYGLARIINWLMFLPLLWLVARKPDVKGAGFGIVATCAFQMIGVGLQVAGLMGGTWGGLLTSGSSYNPDTSDWLKRYTGFILNPNNLALVLTCGIIVLAACILGKVRARVRVSCLALMALFAVGVIATGSRGGLVAVALGVGILLLFAGRRGFALAIVAVTLGVTAYTLSGSVELDRLVQSFSEIISGTDASARQRSGVWIDRFQTAEGGSWAIGHGFGGYAPEIFASQQGLDIDPAAARAATVDNSWLKMLLESGVIGVLGMALTMLPAMLAALTKSSGERRMWGIAAGAVLAAMLWRSVSVDMLDQNPWNALVFLAIGFAAASTNKPPELSTDAPEPARQGAIRPIAQTGTGPHARSIGALG